METLNLINVWLMNLMLNESVTTQKPYTEDLVKEVILSDLQEIVGVFKGIESGKTFIKVKIGEHTILLENKSENTEKLLEILSLCRMGERIVILRLGGRFYLRQGSENG